MKYSSVLALTIPMLALGIVSASATPNHTGLYGALEAGINMNADTAASTDDIDPVFPPCLYCTSGSTFDLGWAVFGRVGYDWGWFRWDILEAGYRSNNIDTFYTNGLASDFTTGTAYTGGGNFDELSLMTNANIDWEFADHWTLSVGGGVGIDVIDYDNQAGFHPSDVISDHDCVFAWQLVAGVSKHVHPVDLFINYRFFNAQSPTFQEMDGFGTLHDDSYSNVRKHTITFGVRF